MRKYWWQELDKSSLDKLLFIKNNNVVRPLYKLLVIIYLGYNRSDIMKDLVGGNYISLIREGVVEGLIEYERGKPPRLTSRGQQIAELTHEFLEKLRKIGEGERERY